MVTKRVRINSLWKSADLPPMPSLEGDEAVKEWKGLKIINYILTLLLTNKLVTILPVLLAQIKAGNNSYKLKNEIREILYPFYQHNKIAKKVDNNLMKSFNEFNVICSCGNFISKRQKKLSKLLSKGFERSVYWNEFKTKSDKKKTQHTNLDFFLESNFVGVNRLFVLVYTNQDAALKDLKLKGIAYQKESLIIIMPSSMEKTFMIKQSIQI